jgi:two-component system alkaline phosphatase synthesis response regulator PhoP
VLALAQVRLDADSHQVSVDGAEVALTVKEFDLLALLMSHPGRVMTREQILADVWGMGWAQTRTIDAHVRTLRRKLGAGGAIIHTVRGVGYKAVAR